MTSAQRHDLKFIVAQAAKSAPAATDLKIVSRALGAKIQAFRSEILTAGLRSRGLIQSRGPS